VASAGFHIALHLGENEREPKPAIALQQAGPAQLNK